MELTHRGSRDTPTISQRTSQMSSRRLADAITRHLFDDRATLKRCSLVCRYWATSTANHLFSEFRWPPCWRPTECIRDESVPKPYVTGYIDLLELLQSSDRIRSAIHTLVLSGHRCGQGDHPRLTLCHYLSSTTLWHILDLLPHLCRLYLHRSWLQIHYHFQSELRAFHLEEVHIIDGHFFPPAQIAYFFTLFTRISKLHLEIRAPSRIDGATSSEMVKVDSFYTSSREWLHDDALSQTVDLKSLHHLTLRAFLTYDTIAFLESTTNLQSLLYKATQSIDVAPISHLQLQSLSIAGFIHVGEDIELDVIARDLQLMTSKQKQLRRASIILMLDVGDSWNVDKPKSLKYLEQSLLELDWFLLWEALSGPGCYSLEHVRMEVSRHAWVRLPLESCASVLRNVFTKSRPPPWIAEKLQVGTMVWDPLDLSY